MSSVATRVGGKINLTVFGTDFRADFSEWIHNLELQLPENEKTQIPGEANIFVLEDRAFVDMILTGKQHPILATYEEGLAAAAIAEAANISFAQKRAVKMSELTPSTQEVSSKETYRAKSKKASLALA
jgi:predicted dehydrogenase